MIHIISSVWRRAPLWVRRCGVWLTESRFAVTCGAVVVDSSDRVLLIHHHFRPGSGWGIPGGFLRAGEQPEDAIRRELREEVGLELEIARLAFIRTIRNFKQVEIIFLCRPKGGITTKGFEANRAEWFEIDALPDELSGDQRGLIERAMRQL